MINSILIAIFLGALYLVVSIMMYNLGRKVGRNEAELDNILQRIKEKNDANNLQTLKKAIKTQGMKDENDNDRA